MKTILKHIRGSLPSARLAKATILALLVSAIGNGRVQAATIYTFTTLAGVGGTTYADGFRSSARFLAPVAIAINSAGTLYVVESFNSRIRNISADGIVSTVEVDSTGILDAVFSFPNGIAIDRFGNLYAAAYGRLWKITPKGVVSTLGQFGGPIGVAIDSAGAIYVTESQDHIISKITEEGIVTVFAGLKGASGSTDGTGAGARFSMPEGLAVDALSNLYVTGNETVRKISPGGVVTTLAGSPGAAGFADGVGSVAPAGNYRRWNRQRLCR
jgi:sugar lactone lactonase YvrE